MKVSEGPSQAPTLVVIAGFNPAIHSVAVVNTLGVTEWMPGSSPGMTTVEVRRVR